MQISISVGPSLGFPVEGRSTRDVASFFGDVRDGGARDHHGVDIFAPRGTAVLAVSAGTVYRVQTTNLGGNVVWVRDPSGEIRQYYAHLDRQLVEVGDEVAAGDVVGLVGNTGNARTTPPHLHFGIYIRREGAVDPYPFVHDSGRAPEALSVSREYFRQTLRVREDGLELRTGASPSAASLGTLPGHLPVRVVGGSGRWYRIRLPTGEEGYALGEALEPTDRPLGRETLSEGLVLRSAPVDGARRVREARDEELVSVLGRSGSWAWVAGEGGEPGGWLPLAVE
jgi:hypothetical protein